MRENAFHSPSSVEDDWRDSEENLRQQLEGLDANPVSGVLLSLGGAVLFAAGLAALELRFGRGLDFGLPVAGGLVGTLCSNTLRCSRACRGRTAVAVAVLTALLAWIVLAMGGVAEQLGLGFFEAVGKASVSDILRRLPETVEPTTLLVTIVAALFAYEAARRDPYAASTHEDPEDPFNSSRSIEP